MGGTYVAIKTGSEILRTYIKGRLSMTTSSTLFFICLLNIFIKEQEIEKTNQNYFFKL